MHEKDMRALVGERDERAVQSAAAALESELHHRVATIALLANSPEETKLNPDLTADFDGGLTFFRSDMTQVDSTLQSSLWDWVVFNQQSMSLATPADLEPVISSPSLDPNSGSFFVIISAYSRSREGIVAGAFTPAALVAETLATSYPTENPATIYLIDSARRLLFVNDTLAAESLPSDHPGVAEAIRGESGVLYVQVNNREHVVAYSPISITGWVLITEEEWEMVISPSLQLTQMAPLVLVPAFILALIALWFGARQIVQPLQRLESKAAALAWGDFNAIKETVGGIVEVQHLQAELAAMSGKVQAAQEGLHDYIGAITSAQEEERLRLARELHDDTIQAVIALKQRVQLAEKSVKDQQARQSLKELETLAEQTIENLRRLTRALRPIYLEDLGLVTALEMLARETRQADHLAIHFKKHGGEQRLPHEVELALYRIAQEALNNVLRHSKAQHAALQIDFSEKEIKLEINDDGIGFDMPKIPTDFALNGHFGLLGMRERADLIGGKLEVRSEARHGTRLCVHLPNPAINALKRESKK